MALFTKNIKFIGKHAQILQKYCKDKGTENDVTFTLDDGLGNRKISYIFETRLECYMFAIMLGIIEKKQSEEDTTNRNIDSNILVEQLTKKKNELERIYRFMMLSKTDNISNDLKIKQCFSLVNEENEPDIMKEINSYARGGLEILDEKFSSCQTYEDVMNTLYDLLEFLNISAE